MFLTDDQLHDLTGYRQRPAQRDWLAANGYRFDVRRDGRPNVLVDQVRERQGIRSTAGSKPGPDFSWLEKAG